MHQVSASFTLPAVLNSLQPAALGGLRKTLSAKASTPPTTPTTAGSNGANDVSSTFLNLLATELQNQDPTAPVDSTAMVGQMISLNQLDQLISINQTVTGSSGTGTSGLVQPATALSSAIGAVANTLLPSAAGAVPNQLPFDPNTMMPLNFPNAAAVGASINSSIHPVSLGSSSTTNNPSGGK